MKPANRILHFDGDSFFASCEIALNPRLQERPIWVGGGRRGDGIMIAARRPILSSFDTEVTDSISKPDSRRQIWAPRH